MAFAAFCGTVTVMVTESAVAGSADRYIEHLPAMSVRHDAAVFSKLHVAFTSTPAAGAPDWSTMVTVAIAIHVVPRSMLTPTSSRTEYTRGAVVTGAPAFAVVGAAVGPGTVVGPAMLGATAVVDGAAVGGGADVVE